MSIYKSLHTLSLHDALASSKRFAREGFLVKVGRRGGDKLQPLVDEIEAAGGRVAARGLDARIPDDVTAFIAEAEAAAQHEGVIFNIGATGNFPILDTHPQEIGKESCREQGCPYEEISVVAVS